MEKRKTRRRAPGKKRRKQALSTFIPLALVICLTALCIIYAVLGGPNSSPQTSSLRKNPYTPADFTMQNGYVTCTAGPTRLGVDVSAYQEDIDWEEVRAAGFDFAFIRIGYRGYNSGNILQDERARENLTGAKAAGLDVGVYFYAQAISPEEAAQEAQWCLNFLAGEALELPVVYDWEWVDSAARTGSMDKPTLTECVKTFCTAVESGGYDSMIYFNSHIARDLMDLRQLSEYPFWLAQYRDAMDFAYQVDIWQYTEEGSVPGIKGNVDIDLMFIYE